VALSVLPFKGLGLPAALAFLPDGLSETVSTEFGQSRTVRLIERAQIDLDVGEIDFSHTKYVDPATRAKLGKIVGAEVVLIGSVQKAGPTLRAVARFVHVETGEVLLTLKLEGSSDDVFDLQDRVAQAVRAAIPRLVERLR
jgi:TolB-like protein